MFLKYIFYIILIAVSVFFITSFTKENYAREPINIALFYATWCGHCTKYLKSNVFADAFAELKKDPQYSHITFIQYDYDKHKELSVKSGVRSFPTILAMDHNGNVIKHFEGNRYEINDLIKFATQL